MPCWLLSGGRLQSSGRDAAGVDELRFVRVVIILDFAIADANLARILVLESLIARSFFALFAQPFHSPILLFELPGEILIRSSAGLLLFVDRSGNLILSW